MDSRSPVDLKAILLMVLLCSIWGLQQISLKTTAPFASPVLQIGLRSLIAAVLVYALIRFKGMTIKAPWRVVAAGMMASFLFSLEFLMLGESIKRTSASHAVVFLYTAPIFAALFLHLFLPAERLARAQWLGIAISTAGIAVAFLGHPSAMEGHFPQMLAGDLLALGAGMAWGATTFVIRLSGLSRIPAAQTLFYQLSGASVLLLGAALVLGQASLDPTPFAIANIGFQAIVVSFASFLTWFWLLTRYRAAQIGVFSLLTPLFGVALGWLLLGDALDRAFLMGTSLVLLGIIVVSAYPWMVAARNRRTMPVPLP